MKVKTSELIDRGLDFAVAKAKWGIEKVDENGWLAKQDGIQMPFYDFEPSTDWYQGGEIIEREIDALRKRSKAEESALANPNPNFKFKAEISSDIAGYFCGFGPTPLIAAMRCYVASKLGEQVEIPEELL